MAQMLINGELVGSQGGKTIQVRNPANGEVIKQGRTLATLGPGSVLGELSLFVPSATRTATARTTSPVRMITWRASTRRPSP